MYEGGQERGTTVRVYTPVCESMLEALSWFGETVSGVGTCSKLLLIMNAEQCHQILSYRAIRFGKHLIGKSLSFPAVMSTTHC